MIQSSLLSLNIIMRPLSLTNYGSTCYLNSTLQLLLSVPELREYFGSDTCLNDINVDNPLGSKGEHIKAFMDFFRSVAAGTPNLAPIIKAVMDRFPISEQQDAHEALTYILDCLHEDTNHDKHSFISSLFYGETQTTMQCMNCDYQSTTKSVCGGLELDIPEVSQFIETSSSPSLMKDVPVMVRYYVMGHQVGSDKVIVLPRVLTGEQLILWLQSEIHINPTEIECINFKKNDLMRTVTNNELIHFDEGSLDIHCKSSQFESLFSTQPQLTDAMRMYFQPNQIHDWKCEKCQKIGGSCWTTMLSLPRYLITTIKLFDVSYYGTTKRTEVVAFPNEFEWNELFPSSSLSAHYKVVATINHEGLSSCGHYYANVQYEDQWYNCNDSLISPIASSSVHDNNVYIILYRQCN